MAAREANGQQPASDQSTSDNMPTSEVEGLRQIAGRPKAQEGPRPTEDDIAKAKLGPLGIPGGPDKAPVADADELQIPKEFEPGHTA